MLGNIGPLELIIILAIILVIFGPNRLPELMNALGRGINEFRKGASGVEEAAKAASGTGLQPNTLREPPAPSQTTAAGQGDGPSGSDT